MMLIEYLKIHDQFCIKMMLLLMFEYYMFEY